MAEQAVRKTFKYRLKPTPDQEQALERPLMLCRHVYTAVMSTLPLLARPLLASAAKPGRSAASR